MIELINFTKDYYSPLIHNIEFSVHDISFKVPDKSVTVILGANGSGKSTILKSICGFHYATKGKILISNQDLESDYENALKNIGYVPELPILPENMTVLEFLDFCYSTRNLSIQNKKKTLTEIIKICALKDVLNKKIKKLSKGFLQRTSVAQALIHNPQNIILDEPFSGLDPTQIIQMRALIKELSNKKSILLSTHIFQEVNTLADNILIISKGQLKAQGTQQELLKLANTQDFEKAFLHFSEV